MKKICSRCKAENSDQARFCISCSAPMTPSSGGVRYCAENRHPMDPGWDKCPYCDSEAATQKRNAQPGLPLPPTTPQTPGRQPTVVEFPLSLAPSPPVQAPSVEPPAGDGLRRKVTVFAGPVSPGPLTAPQGDARRIVAILITYTWRPEGQIFPVREGRNRIGSDSGCDVHLAADPQLSAIHATIIFRGKDFWIDDEKSMNGTFVNDQIIEEKQRLAPGSKIQTGTTVWRFVDVGPMP